LKIKKTPNSILNFETSNYIYSISVNSLHQKKRKKKRIMDKKSVNKNYKEMALNGLRMIALEV